MAEEWVYEGVKPVSREEAEAAFARGDRTSLTKAMLGLAWHDPDWRWVQGHCLRLSRHPDRQIRAISALCLEYLVMFHGQIDLRLAFPVLNNLLNDEDDHVAYNAEGAVERIGMAMYGLRDHFVRERDQLEYVPTMSREEAEEAFASDDAGWARAALYALIQYDPDWRLVQGHCLRLLKFPDLGIRKDAVDGLGWIVSIRGVLDFEVVVPVLEGLLGDPELAEEARDTLESIEDIRSGRAKPSG